LKNKLLYRFIGLGAGIFIAWFLLYHIILEDEEVLDAPIIVFQSYVSKGIISFFGYDVEMVRKTGLFSASLVLDNQAAVLVGTECGGLELIVLFVGFIIAYGGNKKVLLWFIPLGIATILLLNILRISALAIMALEYPQYLDFNHKYTFVIIVYGAIFWLWLVWINRFAYKHEVSS